MLKIERTNNMSNAGNFQWDYKGLTFLDKIANTFLCD